MVLWKSLKVFLLPFLYLSIYKTVVKIKEKFEKTRHVKNNDKSRKYILRGQRNVRYHEEILSNKKKSYNFTYFCTWKYTLEL